MATAAPLKRTGYGLFRDGGRVYLASGGAAAPRLGDATGTHLARVTMYPSRAASERATRSSRAGTPISAPATPAASST
eukprot:3494697-Prymnesium_polylepis.1